MADVSWFLWSSATFKSPSIHHLWADLMHLKGFWWEFTPFCLAAKTDPSPRSSLSEGALLMWCVPSLWVSALKRFWPFEVNYPGQYPGDSERPDGHRQLREPRFSLTCISSVFPGDFWGPDMRLNVVVTMMTSGWGSLSPCGLVLIISWSLCLSQQPNIKPADCSRKEHPVVSYQGNDVSLLLCSF